MNRHERRFSPTAVFESPDVPLRLTDIPVVSPGRGQILVRNEYTTLCRSDLNTFSGKRIERTPTILGHEIVGRIETLGPDAPNTDLRGAPLRPGDRVTWAIYASNPDSELSQRGYPQKGAGLFKYGHEELTEEHTLHGGLSEYCLLRAHTPVVRIDEAVPLSVAAPVNCAVATAAGALRLAGDLTGRRVTVCGAGMLGLFACAMSKTASAAHIVVVDTNPERLEMARRFGADETVSAHPHDASPPDGTYSPTGPEVDVVIEMSGTRQAMETTLDWLAIAGRAVWVGATHPQAPVRVDAERVIRRLLTIKGLHNYTQHDLLTGVTFIEEYHRVYPFEDLIHDGFALSEANEAFAHALTSNAYRVGIRMGV